jgi:hypothetical protein
MESEWRGFVPPPGFHHPMGADQSGS